MKIPLQTTRSACPGDRPCPGQEVPDGIVLRHWNYKVPPLPGLGGVQLTLSSGICPGWEVSNWHCPPALTTPHVADWLGTCHAS